MLEAEGSRNLIYSWIRHCGVVSTNMVADESSQPASNEAHGRACDARLQGMLDLVCDRLICAAELKELDALLLQEKEIREYYLKYLSLHSSLQNYAWSVSDSDESNVCRTEDARRRHFRLRRMSTILAAAAMLAAVWVGFYIRWNRVEKQILVADSDMRRTESQTLPVARVTQLSDDILWQSPNESVALHSHVTAGHMLQLARGEISLAYGTGVKIRLLGPAEFVIGPAGGRLLRGSVRAVVPEKGRGFTIETPNGKVIDLGTEFGVAVDDFGLSEVNVFQGMVDMVPEMRGGAAQSVRLRKGEAVQWNDDTFVRLKADAAAFGGSTQSLSPQSLEDSHPIIDNRFHDGELNDSEWSALGNVKLATGSLLLQDTGDSTKVPYLVTAHEFAPNSGALTIVADIRFTNVDANSPASFAMLTRSSNDRDSNVRNGMRTMQTCVRCCFKSEPGSSSGTVEVATKLDHYCPLTNNEWRGFDQLQENVPYRLVMRDDGINITFMVALRDDLSVNKTVTCRSLFHGKQNFVVFEGPDNGTVAVDRIQLFQDDIAKVIAPNGAIARDATDVSAERMRLVKERLALMAPADSSLAVSDDFDGATINDKIWTTLDDVTLSNGRVRLGKPNSREHINTYTARPYLLTRKRFSPIDGALTIVGTVDFDTNFLNEYGGSFAVMTRADDSRGSGPGWEYSILQRGVRENFWPAAWGQQHSLEIHEKPSATSLSLLVAEGLEINPEARQYFFKVVDDGDQVTLTIQDTHDEAIKKTVSVHTSSALKDGVIGFEGCWGCPVWLDNVRIYQSLAAKSASE
jgi:hypothetical protein